MTQPKLLNLDEFSTATKSVKLDGVTHEMREMTVQEFIEKAAEARKAQADAAEMTVEQQIERAVEMVHDAFPSMDPDRLRKLSIRQLTVLIDFIMKAPEQIEAETRAAAGNA